MAINSWAQWHLQLRPSEVWKGARPAVSYSLDAKLVDSSSVLYLTRRLPQTLKEKANKHISNSLKHSCHQIVYSRTLHMYKKTKTFIFSSCRKLTRRQSRSSTVWRRTSPRTLSQDTSCSTSPETEPATGKSPADCHSTEGGGTYGCHRLRPVSSHKYPGFIPCRRSFALERHSDRLRRVQVACQPPGLRPYKSSEPTLQKAP